MATSKDILFWIPRGQLLQHQRLIPVTNISELVEYVLLPHNSDLAKPRALNTFLDGLAELGVDKRLIKNKKIPSNLLGKSLAFTRSFIDLKVDLYVFFSVDNRSLDILRLFLFINKSHFRALVSSF